MAGVTAQGGTFTFSANLAGRVSAAITSISVETPQAEIVDMTPASAASDVVLAVPTGVLTGGAVTVEYLRSTGGIDPATVVRQYGELKFASAGYTVTRNAVLESATVEAKIGDAVRGTLRFRLTNYTG